MTPTNELRFVERQEKVFDGVLMSPDEEQRVYTSKTIRVLQQKWTDERYEDGDGEWRDVPLVK